MANREHRDLIEEERMRRSRGNSQSERDRRRTERDAELRRRRYRQMTAERLSRMVPSSNTEFPALPRPVSASSSSIATPNTHTNAIQHDPSSLFGPATTVPAATPGATSNASDFMFADDLRPRITSSTRSRSDDGSQQSSTQSIRDRYSRHMLDMQEQLESMRALLSGNMATDAEERRTLIQAATSLGQERAELEEELLLMMEDDEDLPPALSRARRRAGGNSWLGERVRQQTGSRPKDTTFDSHSQTDQLNKTATFLYSIDRAPTGSDVWPDMRDPARVPAKFMPVDMSTSRRKTAESKKCSQDERMQYDWEHEEVATKLVWPMNELPSEIYYQIADHLSRDDIKAMRLTCKEMEYHISGILFKTVVVPFNTEIYGMLLGLPRVKPDLKGKGKGKAAATTPEGLEFWKNSKDEDIYTGYGVDVFKSFGPRMKRFGMSFEVDEEVLANPPLKGTREDHVSYWGSYQWPYPEYKRFDQVAGLEDAADETPKMKTAFSFLTEVQELALSLDAGLGWLQGPDRSIRSRVLGDEKPVFGQAHPVPDRQQEARHWLWEYLKNWAAHRNGVDIRHCAVTMQKLVTSAADFVAIREHITGLDDGPDVPYIDLAGLIDPSARAVPTSAIGGATLDFFPGEGLASMSGPECTNPGGFEGGLLLVREEQIDLERLESYPIVPAELSKLQKEWLLETEWAQRAFLSSWLIAVVDNRLTFQNVHTLNFSRISSRFLLSLIREDLWKALPQLENVSLSVIPDCRDVYKDNAGFVEMPRVPPVSTVWLVHKLVAEMIALRSTIKCLSIGWATGGEHAQGLTARNKNLMPAPLLPPEWLGSPENMADKTLLEQRMLRLPHLQSLTMTNCWITPHALTFLVQEHTDLERLCLESVSLTAEPVNNNGANAHQILAMAQQMQGPLMPANVPQLGHLAGQQLQAGAGGQMNHALLQAVQNVNNLAAAAGLNPPNIPQNAVSGDWLSPRDGSWPRVLDAISPGITLAAAGSTNCPVNLPAANLKHRLRMLEIKSAGYCRLNNARLDESVIPPPTSGGGSPWFSKRYAALSKVMLNTKGSITAEIVQALPQSEEQALTHGFDLQLGWPVGWAKHVEAPTFDACLPGGTGRFFGNIDRSSRIEVEEE